MDFDIKFIHMDDTPLYKKPWFYIAAWLFILLVVYGWQVFRMGGFIASELDILIDLFCIFPLLLVLWLAFFAQFVLPVRTFSDRQKIFDRLVTYLFGGHGPAIFIRDGHLVMREGEERKKGPGVLWLDSASAAVTRSATAIKQTMGPGVHFINAGEFIAGTIDLHSQSQSVGPKESDKPFDKKKDDQSDDEFNQIQDRRKQVSALTRDGIEVVPNISVTFRVDTGFPKEGQPGSRFGFRAGITKKDKENERQDKEAVRKAILGEGINPNARPDSPRHRVAWNQLPAVLAVDVWREYAAKFTLDELFKPDQMVPPAPPQLEAPPEIEIDLLSQPLKTSTNKRTMEDVLTSFYRFLNLRMDRAIKWLENGNKEEGKAQKPSAPQAPAAHPYPPSVPASKKNEPQKKTALQVINEMVKARLTQPEVDVLDDTGRRGEGTIPSREYQMLKDRGLKILSVGISGPRFNPTVEDSIIKGWNASWLKDAKAESEQIERRRINIEKAAEEKSKRQYVDVISREINELAKSGKPSPKETLKALILKSHTIIRTNEQLRRRMTTELQDIEEMIKWIEGNGK
ncbi:MAG: hypothetical protein QM730_18065 [Anaerolineales bacterium]